MEQYSGIELREIHHDIPTEEKRWRRFLESRDLIPEENVEYTIGLFDSEDELVGTASMCGNVMQCVAVDTKYEGYGLVGTLVTEIRRYAAEKGLDSIMVFTKPEYEDTFRSLAFHRVGRATHAVLLESNPRGLSKYLDELKRYKHTGRIGVIVMNANPFTIGHRYLIEQAAARVDHLYVIPVLDTHTPFSYIARHDMIRSGVSHLLNVHLIQGSKYSVSKASFPSYFIKQLNVYTDTHIELDLDIFSRHIAPALGATVRFVGSEPTDPLTARYNELMMEKLPAAGIKVEVMERLTVDGMPVSASEVRRRLHRHNLRAALELIPEESYAPLLGAFAFNALYNELTLTPKPGLVDMNNSGAHQDMDVYTMMQSIYALYIPFSVMSSVAMHDKIAPEILMELGTQAEELMMSKTHGVNTHRGAIFSLGLMLMATGTLLRKAQRITSQALSITIAELAELIKPATDTHGSKMRLKYNIPSALDMARSGYVILFSDWLPRYRHALATGEETAAARAKLLLQIMSVLDDTNVYYRAGGEGADMVKNRAAALLGHYSIAEMEKFDSELIAANISPGGAADMLSLTLLADTLCE